MIALGHCVVPAVGDNIVASQLLAAGTSTLWIFTNVTKDADSDCSGTITGTLLLFMLTNKASIVMNFDVDISHLFSCLVAGLFDLNHDLNRSKKIIDL